MTKCKNCGHFIKKDKDYDYWVHAGYGKGQCSKAEPSTNPEPKGV